MKNLDFLTMLKSIFKMNFNVFKMMIVTIIIFRGQIKLKIIPILNR